MVPAGADGEEALGGGKNPAVGGASACDAGEVSGPPDSAARSVLCCWFWPPICALGLGREGGVHTLICHGALLL